MHLIDLNMVPRVGVEPTRYCYRGILSPLRLPISPPGHNMEAESGIEPLLTALQAAASPFCHSARVTNPLVVYIKKPQNWGFKFFGAGNED